MPFSHSPDYPYTLGGTFQYTDANNIENGVSGAYTELESITANDGTALPSTNGPFTLANFINYLTTLIKSIVGGAHWYSAVPTSLTSLSTGKADLSGSTFTGGISGTTASFSGALTASSGAFTATNAILEVGSTSVAGTSGVDIHSTGGAEDYSARISASGGTAGVTGSATLNITAATFTRNGQQVWDAATDGAGSGLDADTVDGVQASSMLQFGTGGQKTGFKTTIGNVLPTSGMSKGDVHYLSPFALP